METHLSWKRPQPGQEKPKRLSMALNFSASPLKSKKELKHRIRHSDLPTKPPTDRHSTNFTKERKSLKVSHL